MDRRPHASSSLPPAPRSGPIPLLALVAAVLAPLPASAAPSRVLPPSAGPVVQDALARLAPDWTLAEARLGADRADARLCPAAGGDCATFRLTDPEAGCDGTVAGPWCLSFPDGAPPAGLAEGLVRALEDRGGAPWAEAGGDRPRGTEGAGGAAGAPAADDVFRPGALAAFLGLLLLPLLLGVPAGRRLRRRWPSRAAAAGLAALALVVPPVLALAAAPRLQDFGAWDLLALAAALGTSLALGILASPGPVGRRDLAGLALGLALALPLSEAAARLLLPDPGFPWEGRLPGLRATEVRMTADLECAGLFPGRLPEPLPDRSVEARLAAAGAGSWRVLHAGDSLVAESGPRGLADAFPAALAALRPGQAHVNAGYANTGTDFQALLALAWTAGPAPVDRVVLHWYSGNDDADLDRLYACCAGGPLLDWTGEAPAPRCPEPSPAPSLQVLLGRSPTPYALRRATAFSVLARHGHLALTRLSLGLLHPSDHPDAWARLARLLPWLRDRLAGRGIDLVLDALPSRTDLEAEAAGRPPGPVHDRFLGLCRDLGLRCLDAREALLPALREAGAEALYLPGDIHLSPEGHRRLAAWLAPLLDPPAPPAPPVVADPAPADAPPAPAAP